MEKGGILCGAGSVYCNHCFIPVHGKCVGDSGWEKDDNLFCCYKYMTGTVVYDEDGHFKNSKDCLCRFVVSSQGKKCNCFQSPGSTISELKQTISFNISGSNVNN